VVVAFDPVGEPIKASAFRTHYAISSRVDLVGPYDGSLSNGGETVELSRPIVEEPLLQGNQYQSVDVVRYRDELPWPDQADGKGFSLTRVDLQIAGSLPDNWVAVTPTPGNDEFSAVGDVDGDRDVDSHDIDALQAAIRAGVVDLIFDLDQNGAVDSMDVTFLVEVILKTRFGDANLDGRVNFADFLLLSSNFGSSEAAWEQGDFDGDEHVDFADFLALSSTFGDALAPADVLHARLN
jgi:hypothetical protein